MDGNAPHTMPCLSRTPSRCAREERLELNAQRGADAHVWEFSPGTQPVDGFAVHAQARRSLARTHEPDVGTVMH
jgi:hypothetical protein